MVDRRVPGSESGRVAQRNAAAAVVKINERKGRSTPDAIKRLATSGKSTPMEIVKTTGASAEQS